MESTYLTSTRGNRYRVDADLQEVLAAHRWYEFSGGRAYRRTPGGIVQLHRQVVAVDDPTVSVRFRNRDPRDCRRANLEVVQDRRLVAPRQRPVPPWRGSSRFRGVGWHRKRGQWQAFLRNPKKEGRVEWLGFFGTDETGEIRAAEAYDRRARELYGPEAILNFVREPRRRPGGRRSDR